MSVWVLIGLLLPLDSAEAEKPSPKGLQNLVSRIVLNNIPHTFEGDDNWGDQKEVLDGLSIRRDGLRIKTKRRMKSVNHGTWTKYRVRLIDPQNSFRLQVNDLETKESGHLCFELVADADLHVFGRVSHWERGVQLFSFGSDADATVRLTVSCEVGLRFAVTSFPPKVQLLPRVTQADLKLRKFRLKHLSNLGEPLSKRLSSTTREILEREIAKRRKKLVKKLNRELEDHQADLELSMKDALELDWMDGFSGKLSPGDDRDTPAGSAAGREN